MDTQSKIKNPVFRRRGYKICVKYFYLLTGESCTGTVVAGMVTVLG